MSRPFDCVGNKKIDLNKDEHRKVVIERNKKLDRFMGKKFHIDDPELNIKASIEFTIDCLQCGSEIREEICLDSDDLDREILATLNSAKCDCCGLVMSKILLSNKWTMYNKKKEPVNL